MKRMKRKFLPVLLTLLALLVCLFSLAGCGGGNSVTGKYVNPSTSTDIYELKENDAWSHGEESGTYVYTEADGKISFRSDDAEVASGTLKDGTLTVGGKTYKKESSGNFFSQYGMYILLGVIVVLLIVWFIFSGRKNKSRQQEYVEQIQAIRPGNKVKSTGGICGIVVEVCDDNTVIIETGSETSGKSYFKLDKESIYQTDAKGPTQIAREQAEAAKRAAKAGTAADTAPAAPEAPSDAPAEAPAEEPVFPEEVAAPESETEPAPEEDETAAEPAPEEEDKE